MVIERRKSFHVRGVFVCVTVRREKCPVDSGNELRYIQHLSRHTRFRRVTPMRFSSGDSREPGKDFRK